MWGGAFLHSHHTIWAFVHVGSNFAARAPAGSPIRAGLDDASVTPTGYDGQFAYYLAVAPLEAACCTDAPAYRYGRVGLPLAAGAAGLGRPDLVPYALVGINLAAVAITVLVLASWLRRRGHSTWWALVYGFYPGVFQALQTDVNEPLAYALVAVAVYVLEFGGRRRVLWAGLAFSAAALTRETTLLFPAVYAVTELARNHGRARLNGAALALLAAGPYVAYKAYLAVHFGSLGIGFSAGGAEVAAWPLAGLFSFDQSDPREWIQFVGEVLPGTMIAAAAVTRMIRGAPRWELLAYLVNYAALVLFLQRSSYFSYYDSGRVQTGVVLAAMLALPTLLGTHGKSWRWRGQLSVRPGLLAVACVLWFAVVPAGLAAPHLFHVFKL